MAWNLLCRLGRHHYLERRTEDGEPYTECDRCGSQPYAPQRGMTLPPPPNS